MSNRFGTELDPLPGLVFSGQGGRIHMDQNTNCRSSFDKSGFSIPRVSPRRAGRMV